MYAVSGLSGWELIFVVAAIALMAQPIHLMMGRAGRRREWDHAERMKALEMGQAIPASSWPRACVCIAIGAVVPAATFFAALITSLAFALLGSGRRAEEAKAVAKPPAFDPDSFEAADHRR